MRAQDISNKKVRLCHRGVVHGLLNVDGRAKLEQDGLRVSWGIIPIEELPMH